MAFLVTICDLQSLHIITVLMSQLRTKVESSCYAVVCRRHFSVNKRLFIIYVFVLQLTEDMTAKIADFDIARIKRQMHGPTTMTTKSVMKQPGSPFYQVNLRSFMP